MCDVIVALEGPLDLVDDDVDDGLEALWSRLRQAILDVLGSITLKDLAEMRLDRDGNYMFYI